MANDKITRVGLEVTKTSDPKGRISRVGLEVAKTSSPRGRVARLGLEVTKTTVPKGRISRVGLEVTWQPPPPTGRVSQVGLQVAIQIPPGTNSNVSQVFDLIHDVAGSFVDQWFDILSGDTLGQFFDISGKIATILEQPYDVLAAPAVTGLYQLWDAQGAAAGEVSQVFSVLGPASANVGQLFDISAVPVSSGGPTAVGAIASVWQPIMVFDKAGTYLGSIKTFNVSSPPVRYLRSMRVRNSGAATFTVSRHSPELDLVAGDRLVLIRSMNGEEPWVGTMSPRASGDGTVEVESRDAFALLEDGVSLKLEEQVSDGTPAAAIVSRVMALHNDDRALRGELIWQVDSSSSRPFRGNLAVDGVTLAVLDSVIDRSGIELAWTGSAVTGRLILTLQVRDTLAAGAGSAVFDGPGGNVTAGVRAIEDPTPMVHRIKLTGTETDLAACLPTWAQWAAKDITPEVTVEVSPGAHRFRELVTSVDWGLSQSAVQAQCNAIVDWLTNLYHSFLMAIHDIEGRPWHEGWAYLGPPDTLEPMSAGVDSLSRRASRTRLMLVEVMPDEPASAVMLSYRKNKVNLRQWLIVRYNRQTGEQSVGVWPILATAMVQGSSLVRWTTTGTVTLYRVSSGKVISRTTGTAGTDIFVAPYSVRVWDPVARRYRMLRQIINGTNALKWWIDPADRRNVLVDLGPEAALDQRQGDGSTFIGKVYPFERLAIERWDPRRDGVGALIARPTVFNGEVLTGPRWHIVSFDMGGDASTSLLAGLAAVAPGTVDTIEVESIFGFPDADLDADQFPWTGAIDDGLSEEQFLVRSPSDMVGTEWTIVRGVNGTEAILHEPGATVRRVGVPAWDGYPWPDPTPWPEGEQWAQEMLAVLSKERVDLNVHIVHDGGQLTVGYGSTHAVNVATEGPPTRWVGTGRAIGWSTGDGETELVLEWQG